MLPQIHHNPGWHDCAKGKKGVKAQKEAHINELQAIPTEIEVKKQTKTLSRSTFSSNKTLCVPDSMSKQGYD
jgi:hypothetical protein